MLFSKGHEPAFNHIDIYRYKNTFDIDVRQYIMTDMTAPIHLPLINSAECCPLAAEPLSVDAAERYAEIFKVLGEPVRLRILSHLAAEGCTPTTVNELTEIMGLSQPTISHHLKKMTDAGLLVRIPEGRTVFHQVQPETFTNLRTILQIG